MKPNDCLQIFLLAAAMFLTGCSADSDMATPPNIPDDHTSEQWSGDFDRLEGDIPRAAGFLEWALLHVRRYEIDGIDRIHAEALLPNERTAVIDAWPDDQAGRIHVTVHVGTAGDEPSERQFLAALRRSLRMPPVEE